MRLTEQQLKTIRDTVARSLPDDLDYELRLFGSRLNDNVKGGDVDIYLETNGLDPSAQDTLKRRLRPRLEEELDLPVDLIIHDRNNAPTLVSRIAREAGERI